MTDRARTTQQELKETFILLFGRPRIRKQVLTHTQKNNNIIFGGKSVNAQVSGFLQRNTLDFDIKSKTPRKHAEQIERRLDREFRGDHFETVPARFPNTFRVKTRLTNRGVADVGLDRGRIPTRRIDGIRHSTLAFEAANRRRALRDPMFRFRAAKDEADLMRIRAEKRLRTRF